MNKRKRIAVIGITVVAVLIVGSLIFGLRNQPNKKSQQGLLNDQQAQFVKTPAADPILAHLPYGDIGYNITPVIKDVNGKSTLVLNVVVTLSGADYKQSPADLENTINKREQAALDYIRSIGFDPSHYTVEYSVPPH